MMSVKERESLFQTIALVAVVLGKRYYGSYLGEYENILFVFIVTGVFYLIHFLFVKFTKDYPDRDDWEEKLNVITLLLYGLGLLILFWLNVNNVIVMAVVGVILISINVIIKTKRREIRRDMMK